MMKRCFPGSHGLLLGSLLLLLLNLPFAGNAQTTYYSRAGGGNWQTNGTWSTTSHGGNTCNCRPTAGSTVRIGDNDNVTFTSSTTAVSIGTLIIDDDGDGGNLIFGNANTASTLTITGNVTVNDGGTIRSGNTNTALHMIQVGGTLVNEGIIDMNAGTGTSHRMVFNGTAARTVSGAGSFSFDDLTLQTTGANNLTVESNIRINGTLDFAANGLIVVDPDINIYMGPSAAVTATGGSLGTARHIRLDGTIGSNSQVIKVSNGTTASWQFLFPIGTSTGGYTPVDMSAAPVSTNPVNNSTLAVKPIYTASVPGHLRRTFRMTVAGNTNATTFTNGTFSFSTASDVSTGNVIGDYNTIWYLDLSSGTWSSVSGTVGASSFTGPGTGQMLSNGTYFYTIGKSTSYQTWYTYQSGSWNNPDNWTLDPTGSTLVNPNTTYPGDGDIVVILNGYTITTNVDNLSLNMLTIEGGGILDMATSTGHNLGNVKGSGLLRMNGIGLPQGNYTSFVTAGTGGTIEYYNTGGTLGTTQTTYNNLLLSNNTGGAVTYITAGNYTINGNLNVTQTGGAGSVTWQINDASAARRTLTIAGDLTVSAGGRIRAGTGNEGNNAVGTNGPTYPHDLVLYGNLTNSGSIKFFDANDNELADADYTSRAVFIEELQGNAVNVTFRGVTNNTITCNSQTDFYRLIVDKGTGQQPQLTVTSTATANFRLFGPANLNFDGSTPTAGSYSNNSLSIQNGTLRLTGSILIPTLAESGLNSNYGWPIPQTGAMWLDDANVTVFVTHPTTVSDNGRPMLLFGLLRISDGLMNLGYSRGILGGGSGVLMMEGGTMNAYQLRTAQLTAGNNFAYIQSGGTVNIGTAGLVGVDVANYPRFALSFSTCTFRMSGGTLNVGRPIDGGVADENGILINAATSNIEVSGGTVNVIIPNSGVNFKIVSNAPFYDLNISKAGAGTAIALLGDGAYYDVPTETTITVPAKPLVVLNNLTLVSGNTPLLDANGYNITVGGNLEIQANTNLTPDNNTITFNGTGAQAWTNNGTLNNLNNVVVNKSAGTLTLAGGNNFPNTGSITGLTITSGTLDDGGKTLTVTTTLSNSAVHTGSGVIVANGLTSIGGNGGVFGNLNVNTNAAVSVSGNQTISGTLRLVNTNSTLNILSNSLTALGDIYANGTTGTGFNANKRILTNGLRNDQGLTRKAVSGTDLLFPVGTSIAAYSPVTINVTATTAGTITVRPVKNEHPNVTVTGRSLQYYWRVTSAGFAGVASVIHKNYSFGATALLRTPLTNYVPARYDASSFSWSYGPGYNASSTTEIPNFNQAQDWTSNGIRIDGEYTAGNTTSFGNVTVFYSRQSGLWNANTTWSHAPCNGAGNCGTAVPAGEFPNAIDPVVIGDALNDHTVTIDVSGRKCGSLFIANSSTLDCGVRTSLDFGINTTGTGRLRVASAVASAVFPGGDFTNFLTAGGGTVEWYGNTTTIPVKGPSPLEIDLAGYNNLIVSPNAGSTITLPATSLTIYNDFTVNGITTGQTHTNETAARTITVNGNFNIASGVFSIRNGFATSLILNKNMTIANGGTLSMEGGGTRTHTLTTMGSITNNGTATFRNANEVMNITFTGATNNVFTGTNTGASTTLNTLTVNKGLSQVPVLTFDVAGTVTCLTGNWLSIQNGTINFNKPGQTFILTDGLDVDYNIPATARLKVQSGTVTIANSTNDDDNGDLVLSGALEVAGGTVNIGRADEDNDSDIEYASAGTPTIAISSGSLNVNGQVRRSTSTLAGALVYTQSSGTVLVRGRSADNTRGIFEIENNTLSSFTMTGNASLTIERPSGGSQYADLYLNPETSSIATTSTIYIGSNTLGEQTLDINIVPTMGNLTVLGTADNGQTVDLQSNALNVAGTVTINEESTLAANAFDVTIGGNLSIHADGIYSGSANTTIFNGSGAQAGSLSSGSSFRTITVNKPVGTLTLSGVSPTITNLNHLSGILDVTTIGLAVNGDIVINSSQVGTGSITLAGNNPTHTITSSGGSFTNLTFSNSGAAYKNVTVEGNLTINGQLSFVTDNRYLSIGEHQLTFGTNASVSGAKSNAFVRTNGIASDLGVVHNWPLGSSSFTYPIGVGNNYTDVTFALNVSHVGTMTVVPVNQAHPTRNVGSLQRILNYYWIVTRGNALAYSASGSHTYKYQASMLGGTGGALVAGLLDISDPTGWITNSADHGGTATTTEMTFTGMLDENLPTDGNTFHYTAGTVQTLPNPIVPVYSRFADANQVSNPTNVGNAAVGGSWNDVNSWTTSSTGYGAPLTDAPIGVPVVILPNARINMNVNARSAFMTKINGLLVLNNSYGHNLGILSGTGTMRTATNTFPAGNYTAYVSNKGGTIEYVAPMTMNNRSVYNNLSVYSGSSGTVTMTNTDLVLNGKLTIPAGATIDNSVNNRSISIARDWNNSGTFKAGTGTVTFNGDRPQNITGSTTFNKLTVSKSDSTLILSGTETTTVNGTLTLSSGIVETSSTHMLSLSQSATVSGGSSSSFVSGPMRKILAAGSFTFPLGSLTADRYRPAQLSHTSGTDTWTAEYVGNDPSDDSYPNETMNTDNMQSVSNFEYWLISRTGSASADVTLAYNTGSYRADVGNIGDVANLRVAHWDGTQWDLPSGSGTFSQSGTDVEGTVTVTNVTSFSPFTLASLDLDSPLPVVWFSFKARRNAHSVTLNWKVAQEHNNEKFEIERSQDGLQFSRIGTVPSAGNTMSPREYVFDDAEASNYAKYYYRIRQVDLDGKYDHSGVVFVSAIGEAPRRWAAYPNPVSNSQRFQLKEMNPSTGTENVRVTLATINGIVLYENHGPLEDLSSALENFLRSAGAGVYILSVFDGNHRENFKVVTR